MQKVPVYPPHPTVPEVIPNQFLDAGVVPDGVGYFYAVTGLNCLGEEGP
jgi:hypothetical protein